jgi:hypothetical protein
MKNYLSFLFIGILALCSCTKDSSTPVTGGGNITHTPNLIAFGYKPGLPFDESIFHIYDLNHDDNAQKKYIRVQLYNDDSARIVEDPKPMDSIAPSWPADVKSILWGGGAVFVHNETAFISVIGGNFIRENYNAQTPQHAWLSAHQNTISARSLPNGEAIWNGNSGDYRPFYFSYQSVSIPSVSGQNIRSLVPFNSPLVFGQAANAYDWTGVTHFINIRSRLNSFYFFDFKNWRYWKINQQNGLANEFVAHPVKSLDRFLKWPEGWGKK